MCDRRPIEYLPHNNILFIRPFPTSPSRAALLLSLGLDVLRSCAQQAVRVKTVENISPPSAQKSFQFDPLLLKGCLGALRVMLWFAAT